MSKKYPKLCRHKSTGAGYVRIDGKQRYLAGTWHDPAKPSSELLASYEAFKYEVDLAAAGGTHSIAELLEKYTRFFASRESRSVSRIRNDNGKLNKLKRMLRPYNDLTFEQVTVQDLSNIRERLTSHGYAISSVKDYWSHLHVFIKWCISRGFCQPDIALKEMSLPQINLDQYPTAKPPKQREAVSWEQVRLTMPHLSETLQTALLVSLGTGARPQEVLDMRWEDIDTTKPVWEYRPEHHKMKRLNHDRCIYISLPVQQLLKEYQLRRLDPDAEYIFTGAESWAYSMAKRIGEEPAETFRMKPNNVTNRLDSRRMYQAVKRICVREGIEPWTPYQTRHFFAETMLAKLSDHFKSNGSEGLAIEAVSAMLGHKSLEMTQRYSKRNVSLSRDLLEEVNISFSIS